MGNEQSSNSKKYKSNIKYTNSTINNYQTINYDEGNKPYRIFNFDEHSFFLNLRRHFQSPSTANNEFNKNQIIKESNFNLKKISQKEKIFKISEGIMNLIPETLSEFNNVDFISSNFGLKSLENNQNFKLGSNRISSSNRGMGFAENLISDEKLNLFLVKTKFDENEKFSDKSNNKSYLNYNYNTNTQNNFNNEPSLIKEVMDTSTSFLNILEEFEKISSPVIKIENQGENEIKDSKSNMSNSNLNQIGIRDKNSQIMNKSKSKISPNQSIEQDNNSNCNTNYPQKRYVKNINLKNNMKVIQVYRSKDKDGRIDKISHVDESRISSNDKINVSQYNSNDRSVILNKSKKNLLVSKESPRAKVKNIKINLSSKQKSASPDKKVLAKIEQPTLKVDLTNRRHAKFNREDKNLNNSTLLTNVNNTNLSKSPAKDSKDKSLYVNLKTDALIHSPTESTHYSQFDSNQNIFHSANDINRSGNKINKLDVNVIKINPKILKNQKNQKNELNQPAMDADDIELYNTYSKLKMKSLEPPIKENKSKKILNSSNISDDGMNTSVDNSIQRDKNPKVENKDNLNNEKDSQQQKIKNINININELNIINKEENKTKHDEYGNNISNMNHFSKGIKNDSNRSNIKEILIEKKEILKTKISDNLKEEIKNKNNSLPLSPKEKMSKEFQNQMKQKYTENSQFNTNKSNPPSTKQEKQPVQNLDNSLNTSNDIQKLYKLKSLKINLNINQLKKIKDKENNTLSNEDKIDNICFVDNKDKKSKPIADSNIDKSNKSLFEKRPKEINDKHESDPSGSESNSRGITPPRRNTPKFTKSNSNSSDIGDLSDDSNKCEVNANNYNKSNIKVNHDIDLGNTYLSNEDSFMTNINYKHQHRKSNSFGGYNNNINVNNIDTNNSINNNPNNVEIQISKDKSEFNPTMNHLKIHLKESIDGEKFSFQNDFPENSRLDSSHDISDSKINFTRSPYKYVKPKVGFKKSPKEILNRIEETNLEKKSLQSEHSQLSNQNLSKISLFTLLAELSTNKSPKHDSLITVEEKTTIPSSNGETGEYNKSKILYKKINN